MVKERSYSKFAIAIIFAFILFVSSFFHLWKENRIKVDAPSYYTYLPATFIYHDLHLNFIDRDPNFFKDKIWFQTTENRQRLIKHPMGISLALSPFFLIGHVAAMTIGSPQDGYSLPYQNAMSIGVLVYLLLGLIFLRKLLLMFFSEKITAVTLIAVVLGTNLLWYSTFEGLMPHAVSFSVLCVCLYAFYKYLGEQTKKHLFLFAVTFGLSILIRPLTLTLGVYFLITALISKGGFKQLLTFLKKDLKRIVLAAFVAFAIAFLQLCYWKYATGHWIYDVYIDEHFVFDSPQMLPFLFSFRKGFFIYTPIMLFSLIGLIRLFKSNRGIFYATVITMVLSIYILSSWWAWSYGICWGMRPMIDYYSILSIPLAAGFQSGLGNKNWQRITSLPYYFITLSLITLNLFQTWQYKNGLIHYDDMTREAYFKGFFQTSASRDWIDLLKPYDWDRRIKGLPQIEFSKEYIAGISEKEQISFRAHNLKYVAVNDKAQNLVAAYFDGIAQNGIFSLVHLKGDTVCIRSSSGYYLSAKEVNDPSTFDARRTSVVIVASELHMGPSEKFVLEYLKEGDNKIALKAINGKYLTLMNAFPYVLYASAPEITPEETFRLFVTEK